MKIDFMNKEEYKKDKKDVKLIIIAPDGTIYISSTSNDSKDMNIYKLQFYPKNYKCTYHIDYLQVFLNNYFFQNPNYQNLIGVTDNSKTYSIIDQLLIDGYIVFSNNTIYEGIFYILNGTYGDLYINWKKLTPEQEHALSIIEEDLSNFDTIQINKYIDYEKHIEEKYTKKKNINTISNILFANSKKK